MIKALLLILLPGHTWDGIVEARRRLAFMFAFYLLPALALSIGGEAAGLRKWGRLEPGVMGTRVVKVSQTLAIEYGTAQFVTTLLAIFVAAVVVKSVAQTFHRRTSYNSCLVLVSYSLAPWFLLRLVDGYPLLNPWITFAVGLALCLGAMYHGIPRVLNPDPPQAFGIFVSSAIVLTFLCGLARLVTVLLLQGRFHLPQ